MEAFPVGSHVVIELADERKIAGYLVGGSLEDGVLLKVTHKDSEMVRSVSAGMVAEIAGQLAGKKNLWLRTGMALRGHVRGIVAPRASMIAQLQWDIERDLLEQSDDGMQFRELSAQVMTFVNPGAIMLMEATADKLAEAEISMFDQTLDTALEQILLAGDKEATKEEKNGKGLAGREGEAETGDPA